MPFAHLLNRTLKNDLHVFLYEVALKTFRENREQARKASMASWMLRLYVVIHESTASIPGKHEH